MGRRRRQRPKASGARASVQGLPLWLQILGWFFLNILFIALVAGALLASQFEPVMDTLVEGKTGYRLTALASEVSEALNQAPRERWSQVLGEFARKYGVQFALFRNDGAWLAGQIARPPASVLARICEGTPPRRPERREDSDESRQPPAHPPQAGSARFLVREGALYWIGVRLPPPNEWMRNRGPSTLLLSSQSLRAGGLLLEFTPLWIAAGVLIGSALFWIPLVRRITGPLRTMRDAAERMALGRFETRVPADRADELGSLARSLNHLAMRLQDFVSGQTRFLGDIAHELNSPLARMQWALGILEQKTDPELQEAVDDVREEVGHMSLLLQELLAFARAGLQAEPRLANTPLLPLVIEAAEHESVSMEQIQLRGIDGVVVHADQHLLRRAIANVLRNSMRYAANSGPIFISAMPQPQGVLLSIADNGPGVPENVLHRLCDPFFRPESSRSRETGGVGLGLSIVKRCVEACGGSVAVRNRIPNGLSVEFKLPPAK